MITRHLAQGETFAQILDEAEAAVRANPSILVCTPDSIASAVLLAVRWQLIIDDTVFLVPRPEEVRKPVGGGWRVVEEWRCKAIRHYRGDIEMVVRSGAARAVEAHCVYERELKSRPRRFKYEQGTNPSIYHAPIMSPDDRGPLVGAYAVAFRGTTLPPKIAAMSAKQIDAIRKEYSDPSIAEGELEEWFCLKTMIKQVTKALPRTPKLARLLAVYDAEDRRADAEEMLAA